jgi:hypothetical protein
MAKTSAQLQAEIDEALRAKKWQEQIEREDRERRARLARTGPTPTQLYEEYQSDLAAGVFHGESRGRAREFRRTDKATRKRIPDAVRAAIAAGALEIIEGLYRRHATVGGKRQGALRDGRTRRRLSAPGLHARGLPLGDQESAAHVDPVGARGDEAEGTDRIVARRHSALLRAEALTPWSHAGDSLPHGKDGAMRRSVAIACS